MLKRNVLIKVREKLESIASQVEGLSLLIRILAYSYMYFIELILYFNREEIVGSSMAFNAPWVSSRKARTKEAQLDDSPLSS